MARQPFESVYARLELLHKKLQEIRRKNGEWKDDEPPDYDDDSKNPDITFWDRKK